MRTNRKIKKRGALAVRILVCVALMAAIMVSGMAFPTTTEAATYGFTQPNIAIAKPVNFLNGSFESPRIHGLLSQIADGNVPGWTAQALIHVNPEWRNHTIEFWRGLYGVAAAAGNQHVELNGFTASRLYQDAATTPGSRLYWQYAHRGRDGNDTMEFRCAQQEILRMIQPLTRSWPRQRPGIPHGST